MVRSESIPAQDEELQNEGHKKTFNASLLDFVKALLRKWWLFALVGLAAAITGYAVAKFQTPVYESKLSFALDEGGSGGEGGGILNIAAQLGFSMGSNSSVFSGDNIVTILRSRRMIEKTLLSVDTFDNKPQTLIGYYLSKVEKNKTADNTTAIPYPAGIEKQALTKEQDSLLFKTYADLEKSDLEIWKPDRYLNIYEVKVLSPDEKFAAIFTNRLLSETSSFYSDMRSRKAHETVRILEERVAQMKGNLNSSISNKASVQDANVNPAFAEGQVPVLKNQTNIQVYGTAYAEMFKNLEIARYQYLKDIPLFQIIDRAEYPLRKIKASGLLYAILFSALAVCLSVIIFWLVRVIKY